MVTGVLDNRGSPPPPGPQDLRQERSRGSGKFGSLRLYQDVEPQLGAFFELDLKQKMDETHKVEGYNPYQWPCKWVIGGYNPTYRGHITPFIAGHGAHLAWLFFFFALGRSGSIDQRWWNQHGTVCCWFFSFRSIRKFGEFDKIVFFVVCGGEWYNLCFFVWGRLKDDVDRSCWSQKHVKTSLKF